MKIIQFVFATLVALYFTACDPCYYGGGFAAPYHPVYGRSPMNHDCYGDPGYGNYGGYRSGYGGGGYGHGSYGNDGCHGGYGGGQMILRHVHREYHSSGYRRHSSGGFSPPRPPPGPYQPW